MSWQRLSNRTCRRIARITGQTIVRGWAHGGYTYEFIAEGHRHGWLDTKNNEWGWIKEPVHFDTCSEFDDLNRKEKQCPSTI